MIASSLRNFKLAATVLLLAGTLQGTAQDRSDYLWWNPAANAFPTVEGQSWPSELESPYDRLPSRAGKLVRNAVWSLSHDAAGLLIRFNASTDEIIVRYGVTGPLALPHMPATGVSGVDLYAVTADGEYLWCAGRFSFGDTIEYRYGHLEPNDRYHKKGREYRLYLPLYNSLRWLQIGVPRGREFAQLPSRIEKPVVVYGTSIAQGACASRPGMAWTAIVGRRLDRPVINLGFSGAGQLDSEVVGLLGEIDAKVFVLDCLPNLTAPSGIRPPEVKDRILRSVKTLRQRRPGTPILLVEHGGYSDAGINQTSGRAAADANAVMRSAFDELRAGGMEGLGLLTQEEIGMDRDCMVDGTHPSDLGMEHYADAYEKTLRVMLKEPQGALSTTRPVTQFRDADIYDWGVRHRELLTMNRSRAPRIVFIGNSITHYWGGKPAAPIARGADSWDAVLEPLGVRNFGFGWDRVENVLWRVYHDELDGYAARQVVIMIGTNNLQINTDEEILRGLRAILEAVRFRQPEAGILVLGIFPRAGKEERVAALNRGIASLADSMKAGYADPGSVLLKRAGAIEGTLFTDGLHPNGEGYRKLSEIIRKLLKSL